MIKSNLLNMNNRDWKTLDKYRKTLLLILCSDIYIHITYIRYFGVREYKLILQVPEESLSTLP